jgi:hypothetical protein
MITDAVRGQYKIQNARNMAVFALIIQETIPEDASVPKEEKERDVMLI